MARAMRRLAGDLRLIDIVLEVVDARVPDAGRNPHLAKMAGQRPRLVIFSRTDLAAADATARWLARMQQSESGVAFDATSPASITRLRHALAELTRAYKSARAIVLGIPNAGKSTVINGLIGRTVARTEDRAGVTRAAQWFRVQPNLELMDTAGILLPKIDTTEAQWKLALVGAVPRARFDAEDVVARFADWACAGGVKSVPSLELFARTRGFMRRGTELDMHNAAWSYIKDFSDGRFGRITLELPE